MTFKFDPRAILAAPMPYTEPSTTIGSYLIALGESRWKDLDRGSSHIRRIGATLADKHLIPATYSLTGAVYSWKHQSVRDAVAVAFEYLKNLEFSALPKPVEPKEYVVMFRKGESRDVADSVWDATLRTLTDAEEVKAILERRYEEYQYTIAKLSLIP